jgi:hypothetical protein
VQRLQGLLLLQQGLPAGGVAAAQASLQAAAGSGSGSSSISQLVSVNGCEPSSCKQSPVQGECYQCVGGVGSGCCCHCCNTGVLWRQYQCAVSAAAADLQQLAVHCT